MVHLYIFTKGKLMAFKFGSQYPRAQLMLKNMDLTGLSIKGVNTSSLIPNMSGQERKVFSILFKDIYL